MRMSLHKAGWFGRRHCRSAVTLALALGCAAAPGGAGAQGGADACEGSLADLFDRVSPAVVSIGATSINPYRLSERVSHVVGSGVVVDADGLILTNSHVAYGRQSITVTLDDGRPAPCGSRWVDEHRIPYARPDRRRRRRRHGDGAGAARLRAHRG